MHRPRVEPTERRRRAPRPGPRARRSPMRRRTTPRGSRASPRRRARVAYPPRLTVTNTTWLAAAARPSTTPSGSIGMRRPARVEPAEQHEHHAREREPQGGEPRRRQPLPAERDVDDRDARRVRVEQHQGERDRHEAERREHRDVERDGHRRPRSRGRAGRAAGAPRSAATDVPTRAPARGSGRRGTRRPASARHAVNAAPSTPASAPNRASGPSIPNNDAAVIAAQRAEQDVAVAGHGGPWYRASGVRARRRRSAGAGAPRAARTRSTAVRPTQAPPYAPSSPPKIAPSAIAPTTIGLVRATAPWIPRAAPTTTPSIPPPSSATSRSPTVITSVGIVRLPLPEDHLAQQHDGPRGHQHDPDPGDPQAGRDLAGAAPPLPGGDLQHRRAVPVEPRDRRRAPRAPRAAPARA